jgi:hypothetical protein
VSTSDSTLCPIVSKSHTLKINSLLLGRDIVGSETDIRENMVIWQRQMFGFVDLEEAYDSFNRQ